VLTPAVMEWLDKSYYNIVPLMLKMPAWRTGSSGILLFSESK